MKRKRTHAEVLRSIHQLEIELGFAAPDSPRKLHPLIAGVGATSAYSLEPGAVWPVESHNYVQIHKNDITRALLYGAEGKPKQ